MPNYVLTGSNRGIGLEYVRQLSSAKGSNTIFAGVRSLSNDLSDLKALSNNPTGTKIEIFECNTSSADSITSFAKDIVSKLNGSKIDVLINNAGINSVPDQTSLTINADDLNTHINVNVLGPQRLTALLADHLGKGSVVVNLTSGLGSCGKAIVKCTTYAISKAAVNMLSVHQASHLKEKGVRVICIDPGWVKTRMGGDGALIEAKESVEGQLRVVERVGRGEDGGGLGEARFYQYDGEVEPW